MYSKMALANSNRGRHAEGVQHKIRRPTGVDRIADYLLGVNIDDATEIPRNPIRATTKASWSRPTRISSPSQAQHGPAKPLTASGGTVNVGNHRGKHFVVNRSLAHRPVTPGTIGASTTGRRLLSEYHHLSPLKLST